LKTAIVNFRAANKFRIGMRLLGDNGQSQPKGFIVPDQESMRLLGDRRFQLRTAQEKLIQLMTSRQEAIAWAEGLFIEIE
jgi:hypothetical protein